MLVRISFLLGLFGRNVPWAQQIRICRSESCLLNNASLSQNVASSFLTEAHRWQHLTNTIFGEICLLLVAILQRREMDWVDTCHWSLPPSKARLVANMASIDPRGHGWGECVPAWEGGNGDAFTATTGGPLTYFLPLPLPRIWGPWRYGNWLSNSASGQPVRKTLAVQSTPIRPIKTRFSLPPLHTEYARLRPSSFPLSFRNGLFIIHNWINDALAAKGRGKAATITGERHGEGRIGWKGRERERESVRALLLTSEAKGQGSCPPFVSPFLPTCHDRDPVIRGGERYALTPSLGGVCTHTWKLEIGRERGREICPHSVVAGSVHAYVEVRNREREREEERGRARRSARSAWKPHDAHVIIFHSILPLAHPLTWSMIEEELLVAKKVCKSC